MRSKSINYRRVRDHCHYIGNYRGEAHSICNLKLNLSDEIPVVFNFQILIFNNGSNYDYHFVIKEPANELEGKFIYLGENTEKYRTFSVLIEKKSIEIDGNKIKMVIQVW